MPRTLRLKRIGGLLTYRPMLALTTDTVHWGRLHPDYTMTPIMHTACGWATDARHGLVKTTNDSISCKRCARYDGGDDHG